MKNLFNEDYFERGLETGISGYSNFRWIPELTIPLCATIIETLGISRYDTILDYGCAKAFIVKAFRLLHRETYGVDISDYALSKVPEDIKEYTYHAEKDKDKYTNKIYDWVISKDVFEHIPYEEIDNTIRFLKTICKNMFVVVPLAEKGRYVVPVYELDKTHIIREDLNWWISLFKNNGFTIKEATYHIPNIKQNYEKWGTGNGFFILSSGN